MGRKKSSQNGWAQNTIIILLSCNSFEPRLMLEIKIKISLNTLINGMSSLNLSPRAQRAIWKRRLKDCKSHRGGMTQRSSVFQTQEGLMQKWPHRDCGSTRRACMDSSQSGFKSWERQGERRRSGHSIPSLTKKLVPIGNHLQREN